MKRYFQKTAGIVVFFILIAFLTVSADVNDQVCQVLNLNINQ
jgi:hypothetical protein